MMAKILPLACLGFAFIVSVSAQGQSRDYPQGNTWSRRSNHPLYGDGVDRSDVPASEPRNWEVDSTGNRRRISDDPVVEVAPRPDPDVVLPNGKKPFFTRSHFGSSYSMDELKAEKSLRYAVDLYNSMDTPEKVNSVVQSMGLSSTEAVDELKVELNRLSSDLRELLNQFPDGVGGSVREQVLEQRLASLKKIEEILVDKNILAVINQRIKVANNPWSAGGGWLEVRRLEPPEGFQDLRNAYYEAHVAQSGAGKKRVAAKAKIPKPKATGAARPRGGKGGAVAAAVGVAGTAMLGLGPGTAEAAQEPKEIHSVEDCGSDRLCARIMAAQQGTTEARRRAPSIGTFHTAK